MACAETPAGAKAEADKLANAWKAFRAQWVEADSQGADFDPADTNAVLGKYTEVQAFQLATDSSAAFCLLSPMACILDVQETCTKIELYWATLEHYRSIYMLETGEMPPGVEATPEKWKGTSEGLPTWAIGLLVLGGVAVGAYALSQLSTASTEARKWSGKR